MLDNNPFPEGARVLELGGGANPRFHPNVDVRACYDELGRQTVDFTCDLDNPEDIRAKIGTGEFDGVYCRFVIEHLSWRKVVPFLAECLRILKAGGKLVIITANIQAQLKWISEHPQGWDNRAFFDSASGLLFGDQDYPENTHKNFMTPDVLRALLMAAGFVSVAGEPYGERGTDMILSATAPIVLPTQVTERLLPAPQQKEVKAVPAPFGTTADAMASIVGQVTGEPAPAATLQTHGEPQPTAQVNPPWTREEMFDKHYFHGGAKVGGYAREGYWDYPVHEVTVQHILNEAPESVMELGCARGYLLKRLQDRGVRANGLEISRHCWLTRVCDGIINRDVCDGQEWPWKDQEFDLGVSVAVLEHIPEIHLPFVLGQLKRTCRRHLHGIDFGEHDDGFDKTHCTLRPKEWWEAKFREAGITKFKIVDKEYLERGEVNPNVLLGDGKLKINVGSFITMFHHGWLNIDVKPLQGFAQQYHYNFLQHDVTQQLPFGTGKVDLIYSSHMLEHIPYAAGLKLLRDFRRVINPETGAMRLVVPDARSLIWAYVKSFDKADDLGGRPLLGLDDYSEINDGVEKARTALPKLWALLMEQHLAAYDADTLVAALDEAGWVAREVGFRTNVPPGSMATSHNPGLQQILRETIDGLPCVSLYVAALPKVGAAG